MATVATAEEQPAVAGAWSSRVQVIYEPTTRALLRKAIRVWDFEPQKKLDFVWEPAGAASIAPDGTVNGQGKLIWRIRGSASYDPRTVYATYVGTLKDGRPDGQGRLSYRTGEVFEGTFVAGVLQGKGVHVGADGDRYQGDFTAGRANGVGRLATAKGDVYSGDFRDGLKHGKGETRLAGGVAYVSQWSNGQEIGRPPLVADPSVGGLLKAQAGGGDADRVDIAVMVEPRLTEETSQNDGVAYQQMVRDEDIAIFPLDEQMNRLWNGQATIDVSASSIFEDRDWEYAPAFAEVDLTSKDGKKVKIDKLQLDVATSEAYRKPMLSLVEHLGCVGFRPAFSVKNYGWGEVRDLTVKMHFSGAVDGGPTSADFSKAVGSFDQGTDISIKDIFEQAGADTAALETQRFTCPSDAGMNVCKAQTVNSLKLGQVADFVWDDNERFATNEDGTPNEFVSPPSGQFFTAVTGTFDYSWADDRGTVYQASEPFRANIPLFYIDVSMQAECGAGFGGSPEAARFQDVRFKVGQQDYAVDMPIRGNKNVTSYTALLKLQADPAMSSFHQFSVSASFADGSVKRSKPVSFYFLKPRMPEFTPGLQPSADSCYLPQGVTGCSELDPRGYGDDGEGEDGGDMPAEGEGEGAEP